MSNMVTVDGTTDGCGPTGGRPARLILQLMVHWMVALSDVSDVVVLGCSQGVAYMVMVNDGGVLGPRRSEQHVSVTLGTNEPVAFHALRW